MAGVVPSTSALPRKTLRKQWKIHDGPRGSLRRLRSQLAEDGCPESQFVLAKQLLEAEGTESEDEDNAHSAVYWLVRASEQGHVEATELLRSILLTKKGINEQNIVDVAACLKMSQEEKMARRAARELFCNLSAGQDYITTNQLRARLKVYEHSVVTEEISSTTEGTTRDSANWTEECESVHEKLTEEHLISSASMYAQGQLPIVQTLIEEAEEKPKSELSFLERIVHHPRWAFHSVTERSIEYLSKRGGTIILSILPTTELKTLGLLLLYTLLGPQQLLVLIPLVVYYLSFMTMVIMTFKMLHTRKEFVRFKAWSHLFRGYNTSFKSESAELKFWQRSSSIYAGYFAALVLHLMTHPHLNTAGTWLLSSEILVISLFLAALTFLFASDVPWLISTTSVITSIIARLPQESVDFKQIEYSTKLWQNVELRFDIQAAFAIATLLLVGRIALERSWNRNVLPHLITLIWIQLAITLISTSTHEGLIRSTCMLGFILFLVPVAGLMLLVLPVSAIAHQMIEMEIVTQVTVAVIAVALPLAFKRVFRQRYTTGVQVAFAVLALISFMPYDMKLWETTTPMPTLEWNSYHAQCHQPAWEASTVANVQAECGYFAGTPIQWDGHVASVRVRKLDNSLKRVLDFLPVRWSETLKCIYGKPYKDNIAKCHINAWDKSEFEIIVLMSTGVWSSKAKLTLVADNSFKDIAFALRPNDKVQFTGTLLDGLGDVQPNIDLDSIACLECKNDIFGTYVKENPPNIVDELLSGGKAMLNFFFHPVLHIY